jgi:hypothetical protein
LALLQREVKRDIIEKALYYIKDSSDDLETILNFLSHVLGTNDIIEVFQRCQHKFDKCTAFNFQVIPQFSEFLRSCSPTTPYEC